MVHRSISFQTAENYNLIHQHWPNFCLEKDVLNLSCTYPACSLRDRFIACVYYLTAEPKSQQHGHSLQTGKDLWRSPLQAPAESRLSHGVRPGCSGHYPERAGNPSRKGQHPFPWPVPTTQPSLGEKSFPLSPAFLALFNLLPTRA